jgi:methionyl-tRNA formyltransferase
MNIVLLGHHDIASNIALSLLVTAMPEHRYTIMLSGANVPRLPTVAALEELAALEQKLCHDLEGCGHSRFLSFDALAGRTGSDLHVLEKPDSPDSLSRLADLRPDLFISVRYRRILREAAISIPRFGVLNLHSGLLPQYKGMMATFWALLNEEPAIGSTLHYIVDGTIDTGPVIDRAPRDADRTRSYVANVLSLYPDGCRMIVDTVHRIERGEEIACRPQPAAGRYYSVPGSADIKRFRNAGLRLFDGDELRRLPAEL